MEGAKINIKGEWAQFKRTETNNNPLTHDFITKTALIGMIGAVTGKNRIEMKELFPILSEDLKYGVKINNNIKKQSWGFTCRDVSNAWNKAPKQMEFIKDVDYDVVICLINERSKDIFNEFISYCKLGKSFYEPVLGLHNCPAKISFINYGAINYVKDGTFETKGFITSKHIPVNISSHFVRLGFDKIPTYQNNDFWNIPDKYVAIVYPSNNESIEVKGFYYCFNEEKWCLI